MTVGRGQAGPATHTLSHHKGKIEESYLDILRPSTSNKNLEFTHTQKLMFFLADKMDYKASSKDEATQYDKLRIIGFYTYSIYEY